MSLDVEQNDALETAFEKRPSRYVVGIDLGTTNSAVSFIDTETGGKSIQTFGIEQAVDASTSQRLDTLPSFHYELMPAEKSGVDGKHQFVDGKHIAIVGAWARQRGIEMPGRAIASAKSWLCHSQVDRSSDLLPWGGDDDVAKLSPVRVSCRYLEHIRKAWDRQHPNDPLREQDTVVTLPASFDEVARRLTIEAAHAAGIEKLILIEEPQAAFYAWLSRNESNWMEYMKPGQTILVCDIGGGTTDFTLIRVTTGFTSRPDHSHGDGDQRDANSRESGADESSDVAKSLEAVYGLHRVAVGEHLMLGGDNLDLALATAVEKKILDDNPGEERLRPRQWDALKSQCRSAKEAMLSMTPPEQFWLSLPGFGSKLIEGTQRVSLEREWVHQLLIDGFFGKVELRDRPEQREVGFQEFGLPYASDPSVSKHLAAFLWDHRFDGRDPSSQWDDLAAARPDWILFNGGVLESPQIRRAIVGQIEDWFRKGTGPNASEWKPGILEGNRLDLAVSQGAAYFGLARRGAGIKIDAALARAYYVMVDQAPPRALCVMPANAQPGERFQLSDFPLSLLVGQPVQFPVYSSSSNLIHRVGQIVEVDVNSMTPLPPIQSVLELPRKKDQGVVRVILESELTEIGTMQLQLKCIDENANRAAERMLRWRLEFDARSDSSVRELSTSEGDRIGVALDHSILDESFNAVMSCFSPNSQIAPKDGVEYLASRLGLARRDWSPSMLREMWRALIESNDYRSRTPDHEARWLNLLGWCLRPGFGMPGDEWRVGVAWKSVHGKLMHRSAVGQSETIVLWRRIAGGFTVGQQKALFQDVWSKLKPLFVGNVGTSLNQNLTIELLRLLGSLEWLDRAEKVSVIECMIEGMGRKKNEKLVPSILWAMGRLGSRTLVYASLDRVVNPEKISRWCERLVKASPHFIESNIASVSLCWMQWGRMTGDRYRDIDSKTREWMVETLKQSDAPKLHVESIESIAKIDGDDADAILGESLPLGFRLVNR